MKSRPLALHTHEGAQNPAVVQQPDSQSLAVVQCAEQLQVSPPQLACVKAKPLAQALGDVQPPSPVQLVPIGHESSSWPSGAQQTPPSGVQ